MFNTGDQRVEIADGSRYWFDMSGPPHFPASEGSFAVDYRSFDGLIVLGQGDWEFKTKWGTRGSGSIYALRDAGPRVAVAPEVNAIDAVTAKVLEAADFSSRARHPNTGEVVLWENGQGYVAAVYLVRITLTAESKPGTVLEARYRILTDKGRDFSKASEPQVADLERAISSALSAFEVLRDVPSPEGDTPGMGHNNPPDEAKLEKEDFAAVAEELRQALDQPKDEGRLKQLTDVVEDAAQRVSASLAKRYAWFQEGFYNQAGSLAATASAALLGWVAFHGSLVGVGDAVNALTKTLFGWP